MRIFWHPDGLQIVPEDEREYDLLRAIGRFSDGKQAQVHQHMAEGESSAGNRLFELQPAATQSGGNNSARNFNGEENIVSINDRSRDKSERPVQSIRKSDL